MIFYKSDNSNRGHFNNTSMCFECSATAESYPPKMVGSSDM